MVLPRLGTRALCLCNKDWSDFPAVPTLGEHRFCSSLADPADSLHNTEFLQVCYYVTQESPSLLCQTQPTPPTKHCTRRNRIILIKEGVPPCPGKAIQSVSSSTC